MDEMHIETWIALATAPKYGPNEAAHVTVVTRRGGRRIMDAPGERRLICGSRRFTLRDVLYRDAMRNASGVECPACLARLR